MPHPEPNDFSLPSTIHTFRALLFDMDGTIIDSTPAIVKFWMDMGTQLGIPGETILATSHGRRSIDTLATLRPELANWEYVCAAEAKIPRDHGGDAVMIPGSRELLGEVETGGGNWAIVTSGTMGLVKGWLEVMGLAVPGVLVTAEQVEKGKPDPEPYLVGAQRLGVEGGDGGEVLVLEDAPSGVRAGKAAGFRVVALATTHAVEQLREAGADWIVEDMRSVVMRGVDAKSATVSIEIRDALRFPA